MPQALRDATRVRLNRESDVYDGLRRSCVALSEAMPKALRCAIGVAFFDFLSVSKS
ncbi:MAG: hypothetical protein HWQ41_29795 [Nostoc sp. NOS(2021)]|uniref:hypothetical protein n=1 Tax=Nostoc sp. NOS(2021) TaxID=2815407 RepID=UPI0025EBC94A|nr:hypothetical protein [Nostoc sp. NOS(2021)]MBN3899316.1 hypothetical protein [Nostoc sp. NOS(2021)]